MRGKKTKSVSGKPNGKRIRDRLREFNRQWMSRFWNKKHGRGWLHGKEITMAKTAERKKKNR